MKYYKFTDQNGHITYQSHIAEVIRDEMTEITEEEYFSVLAELQAKANAETESAEQSKDDRIAELEAENAALLYQVLTGEELTDV
ncbi:MAG: hypothetical protein IJ289_07540 [Clostridia bacterium]|nr:hypothetical protein [Clostridia bacterium]